MSALDVNRREFHKVAAGTSAASATPIRVFQRTKLDNRNVTALLVGRCLVGGNARLEEQS
jgi:hypothetical protein